MELTQKDLLFINDLSKENKKIISNSLNENDLKVLKETNNEPSHKIGYREIFLDSVGVLSAPKKLSYRNYEMGELIDLASLRDDRQIEGLVACLNEMCGEKNFDNSNLHFNELIEIMLFLYSAWGKEIKLPYIIIDDNNKVVDNKEKYMSLKISEIKTNPIKDNFKEPINIQDDNIKVSFTLPRLSHIIKSKKFIKEKYKLERRKFSDLEMVMEENYNIDDINKRKKIDVDLYDEYIDYREKSNKDIYLITQIMLIHSINDAVLTEEEKVLRYKEVPLDFWTQYNEIATEYSDFGVVSKIDVFNEFKQIKEIRRLQFRLNSLLPTLESKNDKRYNVSFG
jgi:hypothetical protein